MEYSYISALLIDTEGSGGVFEHEEYRVKPKKIAVFRWRREIRTESRDLGDKYTKQ